MMENSGGQTNKYAIASIALAVFGFLIFGGIFAGIGAIGLGVYAKKQIEKGNGTGLKLAWAGIWSGAVLSVYMLVITAYNAGTADGYNVAVQNAPYDWLDVCADVLRSFFQ